ncbi:MAG: hypothetical protein ACK4P4_01240 [Allorhizobium sp.]
MARFICLSRSVIVALVMTVAAFSQAVGQEAAATNGDAATVNRSTNAPPSSLEGGSVQTPAATAIALEGQKIPSRNPDAPQAYLTYKTPYEFYLTGLTVAIMAMATILLCVMALRSAITPDFTRTFVIIVVVFASLFLITAGYSDKQAAPVYSLLGTIVGYIFGRLSGNGASTGEAGQNPNGNVVVKPKESPGPPY